MNIRALVDELVEKWQNGQRTGVIASICCLRPAEAALISAYVYERIPEHEKAIYGRLLEANVD